MPSLKSGLFVFALLCLAASGGAQIDYGSPVNLYTFAEYLEQEGDYARAAGELRRYLIAQRDSSGFDSVYFQLGRCYRRAGRPEKARAAFERVIATSQGAFSEQARFQVALTYFHDHDFAGTLEYLRARQATFGCAEPAARQLELWSLMHQGRWAAAVERGQSLRGEGADPTTALFAELAVGGTQLPRRSPALAAALATVVPGAGKLYAGRLTDALYSVLFIGVTSLEAYRGFERDGVNSTRGWIFGTLAAGFHLGGVYGSAVAVKIYNERLERDYLLRATLAVPDVFK